MWGRRERFLLIVIFLVALAARLFSASHSAMVHKDSATYVAMARWMTIDDVEGLRYYYPPALPSVAWMLRWLSDDPELCVRLVGVISTSLAIFPLYFLTRRAAGAGPALATVLVYSLHPALVRSGATPLSEGLFLSLLVAAAACGVRLSQDGSLLGGLGMGSLGALAYLTRPEGLVFLAVAAAWGIRTAMRLRGAFLRRHAVAWLAAVAAFVLVAAPYLVFMRLETGQWVLTMKERLSGLGIVLGVERFEMKGDFRPLAGVMKRVRFDRLQTRSAKPPRAAPRAAPHAPRPSPRPLGREASRLPEHLARVPPHYLRKVFGTDRIEPLYEQAVRSHRENVEEQKFTLWGNRGRLARLAEVLSPLVFPLLFAGIVMAVASRSWMHTYLLSMVGVFVIVYLSMYSSRRHYVPLVPLCLPTAALGLAWAARRLVLRCSEVRLRGRLYGRVLALFSILTLGFLASSALRPESQDKVVRRVAGAWLAGRATDRLRRQAIVTDTRFAYYSGTCLRQGVGGSVYFAVLQHRPGVVLEAFSGLDALYDLTRLATFRSREERIDVFEARVRSVEFVLAEEGPGPARDR